MTVDNNTIYYLPGRGGRLNKGLGEELLSRGYTFAGRELVGDFAKLPFGDQIQLVANDLQRYFWHEDAKVIANSFGAYLFLHAQTLMPCFPGKVLLLSPIVGGANPPDSMQFFCPPRDGKLEKLIHEGSLQRLRYVEAHVGDQDWQSDPNKIRTLLDPVLSKVYVAQGQGHSLNKSYVQGHLSDFLTGLND